MAFTKANLTRVDHLCGVYGTSLYHYSSPLGADSIATILESGYINNTDDDVNLRVGDVILITQPGTQTDVPPMKQVVDFGIAAVASVNATTGAVDLSSDLLGATLSYTA
jgi:hypothetical protein